MDNEEKIEKVDTAIYELEALKEIIKDESNSRMKFFMETCFNAVFGDKIPYTLRCRLLDLYSEFTKQTSGGDEWYGFTFHGHKEFDKIVNEIKLWTDSQERKIEEK